jgi:uncharacterized protein DUF1746
MSIIIESSSSLLLAIRAIGQFFILNHLRSAVSTLVIRSCLGWIVGVNLLSFLLHATSIYPSLDKITGRYQSGGLLIDFIGQIGPISKGLLLILDVYVLILQLSLLSILTERLVLENAYGHGHREGDIVTIESILDLDVEGRGSLTDNGFCNLCSLVGKSPITHLFQVGKFSIGTFWLLDVVKLWKLK